MSTFAHCGGQAPTHFRRGGAFDNLMSLGLNSIIIVAGVLLPVLAFCRAARHADAPARELIMAPVSAGAVVSACFLALVFLRDSNRVHDLTLYPYAVGFTLWGMLVGAVGAFVRGASERKHG